MKKMIPLGRDLIIRCDISEKKSGGGIIIAAAGTREAEAPEEAEIVVLGENAFEHLDDVKPVLGDRVVLARYDGKAVERCIEDGTEYEYRVIQDTRILAIVKENVEV